MTRQAVTAPTPRPPRFGLVASATVINDTQEWQEGIKYAPEHCDSSGRVALGCRGNTDQLDDTPNGSVIGADPFVVYGYDRCSTFGWEARDYAARARRQLEASRSFEIAEELWTGDLNDGVDTDNRALVDPRADVLTTAAVGALDALACVESGLAAYGKGSQGMVHVTAQLLAYLVGADLVRLDGTTYVTPNGHLVVPDAGYDGTGPLLDGTPRPAVTSQWMYGTSMLYLRMSDVSVPNTFGESVDRATNTVVVYAQQLALVEWGDECAHVAAEVNVAPCATGGVS